MKLRSPIKPLAIAVLALAPLMADPAEPSDAWAPSAPAPDYAKHLCAVTVMYAPNRPAAVQIHFSGETCDQDEVALAHALAALLVSKRPAIPL